MAAISSKYSQKPQPNPLAGLAGTCANNIGHTQATANVPGGKLEPNSLIVINNKNQPQGRAIVKAITKDKVMGNDTNENVSQRTRLWSQVNTTSKPIQYKLNCQPRVMAVLK
jgi:hypothetical protein